MASQDHDSGAAQLNLHNEVTHMMVDTRSISSRLMLWELAL